MLFIQRVFPLLSALLFGIPAFAADSRLQQIIERNTLQVCIWPDYYSISYRDPRSQQLSGIDIDLAHELASDLGVQLEFIDSSFARLIPDLQQEACDIAMFGIGIIPEREQHLAFTTPHLFSDVMAITTRSNRRIQTWDDLDQPGNIIVVAKGTLHEPLMRERLKHAELGTPDTPKAREQEVRSGRADAFITDFPYSLRMLETTRWARLVKPEQSYHLTYYAWAVKQGDSQWLERLNQFVDHIRQDGRLLAAARKHNLEPAVVIE
ncbi:MAG: amino acid ABC transporter substrate-binding protein [Gammaproteobacteria bacterium]|nr:amino acid ABC transporter substrate-binding protein [Gammaproteobacteria bacterium]